MPDSSWGRVLEVRVALAGGHLADAANLARATPRDWPAVLSARAYALLVDGFAEVDRAAEVRAGGGRAVPAGDGDAPGGVPVSPARRPAGRRPSLFD